MVPTSAPEDRGLNDKTGRGSGKRRFTHERDGREPTLGPTLPQKSALATLSARLDGLLAASSKIAGAAALITLPPPC